MDQIEITGGRKKKVIKNNVMNNDGSRIINEINSGIKKFSPEYRLNTNRRPAEIISKLKDFKIKKIQNALNLEFF